MLKRKVALTVGSLVAVLAMALPAGAGAQNTAGDSLVNVQIGDVLVELPIAVAANVCDVNVNVLARQADVGDTTCTADADATATPPQGPGGHQNNAGNSLVNVQAGDITVLVPIGIAANICDLSVNALAEQLKLGNDECEATATPTAG
jgi:hypothetical protein